MKTLKALALLSFMALLSFGVASCFNPSGPGNGGKLGNGDTVKPGRLPIDTIHHRDTLCSPHDTLRHPPPDTSWHWRDSTNLDSLHGRL